MALPQTTDNAWFPGIDLPGHLFGGGRSDYELYEEDDAFVLSVELPGFDADEIGVSWDDGFLNVAAEHRNESGTRRRTYHRRFRFPMTVDEDDIEAHYVNGMLEVRVPKATDAVLTGTEIEVQT